MDSLKFYYFIKIYKKKRKARDICAIFLLELRQTLNLIKYSISKN